MTDFYPSTVATRTTETDHCKATDLFHGEKFFVRGYGWRTVRRTEDFLNDTFVHVYDTEGVMHYFRREEWVKIQVEV